ncbi:MAG TPA: glycoside hydrolase family 3 N-terminal domain-containing protein [Acidimicrobiia bacterium]|nr:glycoside hydrolase family 3 N-terminal domain-containing protein [Acidimicrobiia bacterium]
MTDLDALLARMTLDEKLAQLGCVWCSALIRGDGFSPVAADRWLAHGIGEITRIGATTGLRPRERAEFANAIQSYLVDHTRLGIPAIVHEESTAGLCARDATQFPQAIGLASAWDPELLERIGTVIRAQMVATGARHTLAPVLDVARDARWGRVEETYGESPYLVSRLGVAYVRGVQGDLREGVAATGKHFLGYAMSEGGLNHAPVHLGPRELREVYAEPFRAAIAEAGLSTVMNSYSSVDGLPCGGSRAILHDLLRGELGFGGAVVADYSTTELLMSHHRVAATKEEVAQRALEAGLDMELPQLDCYGAPLKACVDAGTIDVALVDRSVRRVLHLKDQLGLFDDPFVDEAATEGMYGRDSDRALAREAAVKSLVLLRNDGVLPLARDTRVAVIGPGADDVRLLQGDYSYPAHTEIVQPRDDAGRLVETPGRFAAGPYYPESVTPLAGIRAVAGSVMYARGCGIRSTDTSGLREAAAVARDADVAVCVVGGRSGLMPNCTSGEFRDVTDLALPGAQQQLVETVVATGTPTIVVVLSGRPHALGWISERASALLYAWLPGEQGGAAIADILYGIASPSGRLPISLPRSAGQVPVHHDTRAGGGRSMIYGDYVDGPASPLYPFGFGLSYTTFAYADLRVDGAAGTDDCFDVSVRVTNTGLRAGTDVVQLYLRDEVARVARPNRQLAGFVRLDLAPGESSTVRFTVDPTLLAYYDEDMRLVIEPGSVCVMAGDLVARLHLDGPEREIAPNDRRPTVIEITS